MPAFTRSIEIAAYCSFITQVNVMTFFEASRGRNKSELQLTMESSKYFSSCYLCSPMSNIGHSLFLSEWVLLIYTERLQG